MSGDNHFQEHGLSTEYDPLLPQSQVEDGQTEGNAIRTDHITKGESVFKQLIILTSN